MERARRPRLIALTTVCVVLIATAVLAVTWQTAYNATLKELIANSRDDLETYVANLHSALEKFEYLPSLLARDRRLAELLKNPTDYQAWVEVNRYLESVARLSGASAIYLINDNALTVAASNWHEPVTFIGDYYGFRPYYQEAINGGSGRFYALGWTSGKRGYYFSQAVKIQGRVLGVVVVKVALGTLEAKLGSGANEFAVVDPNGVVFLSTQPEWRYRTLRPLNAQERRRLEDSKRYGKHPLKVLPITEIKPLSSSAVRLTFAGGDSYLKQAQPMPEAGWSVHILTDIESVTLQATQAVVLAGFGLSAFALGCVIVVGRRAQAAALRRAHSRLEQRVAERTSDLTYTNFHLTQEIAERRRTEVELRNTRDELVQAAKLATIGELSAGINHELNQPLTAIRSYADNARALLDLDRAGEAGDNLRHISALTDHMGRITNQLKLFVRKSAGTPKPVSLQGVVDGALALLNPKLSRSPVSIDTLLPENAVVQGDLVRLEQVFVNLIGNALQALEETTEPHIVITAKRHDDRVIAEVYDNGPGIPEASLSTVFDAFVTTKDASRGIGLGLSISRRIVEELDGTLRAYNRRDGGALFILELPVADT